MSSDICVVIPALNAAGTIVAVIRGALKYVSRVIVADDGSTDDTAGVARASGAEVISIGLNRGKGNALKVLFERATAEGYAAVISMDADGQHDPEEIPRFLSEYRANPGCIIVGSRMRERDKIPRARYNSMHIARFYVSLVANQFVEDTQCGYRLYPLDIVNGLKLVTEKYVTETEILMKAGDMGVRIHFVTIRTIYGEAGSHFRPVTDVTLITAYVISYVHVKWLIEGVSSNRPNTYSPAGYLRDRISRYRLPDILFKTLTAFTALPASVFYLLEYLLLPPLVPGNFASIRKLGCGFWRITLATQMLPVTLVIAVAEKILGRFGVRVNILDGFILKYYPHLW
jgi:glycosyltransferase involved in cell wall biosynthesis